MQQVLQEVCLPGNRFSSLSSLNVEEGDSSHTEDIGDGKDPSEKQHCRPTQGTGGSNKENVSQLDYGSRDECTNDHGFGTCSILGADSQTEGKGVLRHFFKPSDTERTVMERIPGIVPSSPPDPDPTETDNSIVAALLAAATSRVPCLEKLQEILGSKDLPTYLREAYPHCLISSVFQMMLRHKAHIEAQVLGAQFLQKTAIHVPSAANEIGKRNGIQLIIRTMVLNKNCLAVQTAAAAALAVLCSTSGNRIIAGEFYAIEAIMAAAQKFAEEKYLQGACMKILMSLASEPENVDVIVNSKCIRQPLRVIKIHRKSNVLVRIACECTRQVLKSFDETDMEEIAQINSMKILISALMTFPDDQRIQVAATECVTLLCGVNSECLWTCVNSKGADLCVRNLKRFRGCEHARLHYTCMELLCLFAEAGFSKAVVTAGGVEGCLPCMIEMRKLFSIQVCCLRLLEEVVTTGEESFLERIVSAGGLEIINASLKAYILREEFVDRGVRVMRVLRG